MTDYQVQLKEDTISDAISEFEVLEDSKKVDAIAEALPGSGKKSFLWFSPELILKFLIQQELGLDENSIDKSATIFLSSSLEYFVNRLLDIVGHKSSPALTKPAFQSAFEEGEVFHNLWVNLHAEEVPVVEEPTVSVEPSPTPAPEEEEDMLEEVPQQEETLVEEPVVRPPSPQIESTEFLLPEPRLDVHTVSQHMQCAFVNPLIIVCCPIDCSAWASVYGF